MERRPTLPQMRFNTLKGAWKLRAGTQTLQVQNMWKNIQRQDWNPIPVFPAESEGVVYAHPPPFSPAQPHSEHKLVSGQKLHDHI